MITTSYLREIMKANSKYIKVKRESTHTIPKGVRRNFSSIETLHWLIKTLKKKNKKVKKRKNMYFFLIKQKKFVKSRKKVKM